jgi:hypothetical protein
MLRMSPDRRLRRTLASYAIGKATERTAEAAFMGDWQLIVPLLQSWLDQWAGLLSRAPEGWALAALLLPLALAIFSRQMIAALGCILLAAIALCALVSPSSATAVLATGLYLGSLIVALSGVLARRRARQFQAELASLRSDVNRMLAAEESRFLSELRSSSKERNPGMPAHPASAGPQT